MTRAETAAALVRMLQEEPQSLRELAACFDEDPSEIRAVLGWLAGEGLVQNLGGSWRICPGSVPKAEYSIPDTAAAPRVAQAAVIQPPTESPEPDDMAKTKVCNRCEERKPLTAYSKNKATPDGLQRTCRPCLAEYQASVRKGKAPAKAKKKPGATTISIGGNVELDPEKFTAAIEKAVEAEPAPLLHPAPACEVSNTALEVFSVLGALVVRQTAEIDGRTECQALLIPRAELRALIDTLTRHI